MTKNILITGATGFLGRHIVPKLAKEGYRCIVLTRDPKKSKDIFDFKDQIVYLAGDITDSNRLTEIFLQKDLEIDYIIHLAALLGDWQIPREQIRDVNYLGTKYLLEKMPNIKRFIFCSTPGVLGFGYKNADENRPYNPRGCYEISKAEAEKEVQKICQSRNIEWTIIRPDFVYGPGDTRRVALYKRIRDGKMYIIGNGQTLLSPTYAEDVADAFLQCVIKPEAANNIFHISGNPITVQELFTSIADLLNTSMPRLRMPIFACHTLAFFYEHILSKFGNKSPLITKNRIEFLTKHHSVNYNKAHNLLGYKPCFNISAGMEKTLDWCKKENLL